MELEKLRPTMSREELERAGHWWESVLFGKTVEEVVAEEQRQGSSTITVEVVEEAVKTFECYASRAMSGDDAVAQSIAFAKRMKRMCSDLLAHEMERNKANDNKGTPFTVDEIVRDGHGNVRTIKTTRSYRRTDVVPVIKSLSQ